jgi:D-glycero-alpha-D-manno-heptose-7-phosphate kinase
MHLIRAKAPLRVSFAGGGTDVPPFPEREGGLVLSATINHYAYGGLRPRRDGLIGIESLDLGMQVQFDADDPLASDGNLDLVKAAIRKLGRTTNGNGEHGFDLFLHSSAPPGSGLGSSSTMMVALVGLLKEYQSLQLTDYELADMAYVVERQDLGLAGGLQDHYAATFGGFNFIEFHGDRTIVNPLRISPSVVHELEHNLLLVYTGKTRRSDGIIDDQKHRFENGDRDALAGLRTQKKLAVAMKDSLLRGQLTCFGELLDEAWHYKKRMSPRISTEFIEEIYSLAKANGALGGKVTGAGGGGFMLFYCQFETKHRVASALTEWGAQPLEFAFDFEGLNTWRRPIDE